MTPLARWMARCLPRSVVPLAMSAIYAVCLLAILLTFHIRATGIPYADQRDTGAWRGDP